jgi:hypothetical protein
MKYRVLKPHGGKIDGQSGIRREGEVYPIADEEAAVLLNSGHIEIVPQPTHKPKVTKNGEDNPE